SLPCNPGAENFTVDMLSAKLQDISEHPEENQPIVLQSTNLVLDEPSDDSPVPDEKVDSASSDSKDKAESPSAESKDNNALDVGIRLRTKPSSNFGAPLGSMGGWRR
ncbi:hypothetical protein KCU79_g18916, partial [Aureobasidium melanogenum]